jgi:hypothetical protein
MALAELIEQQRQISGVTGRYVLGADMVPGLNVFACRLKSISADGFVAAAPVAGKVGDLLTADFAPFGTLHGRIARHAADGFVVELTGDGADLAQKIDQYQHRVWEGPAEKRGEERFMPGEPRSVILFGAGKVLPCLVIDYSASGVAVSADIELAEGTPVTVGQVCGKVVRGFDVGFAVKFDALQDRDEVEQLLEAPQEWREAVQVVTALRIDTDEGEDLTLAGAAY